MRVTAPSRAVLVGLAASLALLAVWYELLWSPQATAIAAANRKQQAATTQLVVAEQRLGHLKRLSAKASALDASAAKVANSLPDHDDLDNFLVAVNGAAQAAGVSLTNVGVTPPAVTASNPSGGSASLAGVSTIPLSLAVNGGYFAIQRFLGLLRDGQRLIVIDTVALSGGGAPTGGAPTGGAAANGPRPDGTQLSASIGARLFMIKGTTPPGQNPSPAALTRPGTGVLETPINAARSTAGAASANATGLANNAARTGGTP
jgi:Tfp pilus assembly protein PilO